MIILLDFKKVSDDILQCSKKKIKNNTFVVKTPKTLQLKEKQEKDTSTIIQHRFQIFS